MRFFPAWVVLGQTCFAALQAGRLVVVSSGNPYQAKASRRGANAKLVILSEAAHLSNVEQAEAFNQALLGFLQP